MSERIDHAAEAEGMIGVHMSDWRNGEVAIAQAMEAQVHATLALVEQQRIANLIAYVNKWTDGELLNIDAEIRKALGIE